LHTNEKSSAFQFLRKQKYREKEGRKNAKLFLLQFRSSVD
jgi:hypothetical protein